MDTVWILTRASDDHVVIVVVGYHITLRPEVLIYTNLVIAVGVITNCNMDTVKGATIRGECLIRLEKKWLR